MKLCLINPGAEKVVDVGEHVVPILRIGNEAVSLYREAIKLLEGD